MHQCNTAMQHVPQLTSRMSPADLGKVHSWLSQKASVDNRKHSGQRLPPSPPLSSPHQHSCTTQLMFHSNHLQHYYGLLLNSLACCATPLPYIAGLAPIEQCGVSQHLLACCTTPTDPKYTNSLHCLAPPRTALQSNHRLNHSNNKPGHHSRVTLL